MVNLIKAAWKPLFGWLRRGNPWILYPYQPGRAMKEKKKKTDGRAEDKAICNLLLSRCHLFLKENYVLVAPIKEESRWLYLIK